MEERNSIEHFDDYAGECSYHPRNTDLNHRCIIITDPFMTPTPDKT